MRRIGVCKQAHSVRKKENSNCWLRSIIVILTNSSYSLNMQQTSMKRDLAQVEFWKSRRFWKCNRYIERKLITCYIRPANCKRNREIFLIHRKSSRQQRWSSMYTFSLVPITFSIKIDDGILRFHRFPLYRYLLIHAHARIHTWVYNLQEIFILLIFPLCATRRKKYHGKVICMEETIQHPFLQTRIFKLSDRADANISNVSTYAAH